MLSSATLHDNTLGDSLAFLSALWPNPPDGWLLIWVKDDKRSVWFPSAALADAARAARVYADNSDVYVGCGLSPAHKGPRNRCEASDIIAIPGLWADVDIQGSAHKKADLPSDAESALTLIRDMPKSASLVVNSGHGLQPWWLFDRPWVFRNEGERKNAAGLVASWQGHLRKLAACRGWTLDSTQDLARVLRLPGTMNHKVDPVPVTLDMQEPVPRYAPAELLEAIPQTIPLPRKSSLTLTATVQDDRALALAALAGLNANRAVDYDSWLAVGMALHSVDSSASMCDEWDRWSRMAPNRYTEGACAAKWKSFDGSGGITIGSLIHWARADGWIPPGSRPVSTPPPERPPAIDPDIAAEQITHAVLETLRNRPPLARTLLEIIRGTEAEEQRCA